MCCDGSGRVKRVGWRGGWPSDQREAVKRHTGTKKVWKTGWKGDRERSGGAETTHEEGEELLLGIGGGQMDPDTAGSFLHPGSDFQETPA